MGTLRKDTPIGICTDSKISKYDWKYEKVAEEFVADPDTRADRCLGQLLERHGAAPAARGLFMWAAKCTAQGGKRLRGKEISRAEGREWKRCAC